MCWTSAHNYLWRNKASLAKYDHTKPSPYVNPKFLLIMRIIFGVLLLCGMVLTIVVEGDRTLVYLGGWTLYLTLIEFIILVIAQVRNKRKLAVTQLDLHISVSSPVNARASALLKKGEEEIEEDAETKKSDVSRNTLPGYRQEKYKKGLWKWAILGYQTCFPLCLTALYSVFYKIGHGEPMSSLEVIVHIIHHALPAVLLMIEYPFNQIPFDWRHYSVTILVVLPLYILFFVLYQSINDEPIYDTSDSWTGLGIVFAMFVASTLNFAILWALTMKWKLPRFQKVEEDKRLHQRMSWIQDAKIRNFNASAVSLMTENTQVGRLSHFGGDKGKQLEYSIAPSSQATDTMLSEDEDFEQDRLMKEYEKTTTALAPKKMPLTKYGKKDECSAEAIYASYKEESLL